VSELPAAAPLHADRDFRVVLVGQGVSAIGDAVSFTALPLLVLFLTGSGLAMGIVGILSVLPDLLVGLLAGALADRWDRRRLMLAADLGRGLLTAAIPLAHFAGLDTMTVIIVVTAPINVLRVLFMAAYTAYVPMLVGRERITAATSYVEVVGSVGFMLGPGIAGILSGTIGPAPTLLIDAASFLVSSVSLLFVRRRSQPSQARPGEHLGHEIAVGIRFLAGHRVLRPVLLFWALSGILAAPLIAAVTYYVTRDRGLPTSDFGLVISGFSVGNMVGAVISARILRGALGRLMVGGEVLFGLVVVTLGMGLPVPVMSVLAFVGGAAGAVVAVAYITIRAAVTPNELLGRVGSTARTLSVGLQPLGLLAGGLVLDVAGGAVLLVAMGVLLMVKSLAFGLSPAFMGARALPHAGATSGGADPGT